VITHTPTGRTLRYGQVAQKAAGIKLSAESSIKTPDQYKLMKKPTKLLETPPRVDGSAVYGIDVRLPGMLYAASKACPVFQGRVKKYDADAVKNRLGVHSVVEFGGPEIEAGVAVVAAARTPKPSMLVMAQVINALRNMRSSFGPFSPGLSN